MTPPLSAPLTPNTPARARRRLPRRLAPVVFAFYMAAIMATLMCCVIVGAASGFGPGYLQRVWAAYLIAMPAAFCSVMLVRPVVARLVAATVHP
ncbi:DUF2798 domain-containing protein [Acidovorax sp. GBBC 3334]|uniref:DUF2798 domain-containing protein n=1 Tax=unclassified Acidovorax TaxID=2684926 RepID=UPI002303104D|nr:MULTISPECIES: DUF2798 domain-containing protein [unclassified Acidovorax]MDA8457005.1 DUF2798 domain-containing protein [Acidovorax sp. GBBC 3334]MDA8519903.1 DUF2798 domain-containing protein [Acidovorax sp. NCPPB 4044]